MFLATKPFLATAVVFAAISTGCNNGLPLVPISGKITFDEGECPSDGRILFKPIEIEAGLPARAGTGQFQRDGHFVVTSFEPGDGLLPGRYSVEITCLGGMPDFSKPNPLENASLIASGYTPAELIVVRGVSQNLKYDVPLKK